MEAATQPPRITFNDIALQSREGPFKKLRSFSDVTNEFMTLIGILIENLRWIRFFSGTGEFF